MPLPAKEIGILIVDDFPTMRKILKLLLRELGFSHLFEAEDGEEALRILRGGSSVHLVVSDWHMPRMSGLDLLREVRSDPKLEHLPFLMITAEADRDHLVEAAHYGVSNYIMKPFNAPSLREKIEVLFR
jgi:two-component system chemotaxis response regulator CheY